MPIQAPTKERLRELVKERPSPAMIQEVIRALFLKIMQDKILLGLVIVGVLAVFVGGMALPDDDDPKKDHPGGGGAVLDSPNPNAQPVNGVVPSGQAMPATMGAAATPTLAPLGAAPALENPNAVKPDLAVEFVKWWIGGSMDYTAKTADPSHQEAFKWMTPEAQQAFQTHFWSPEIASGITSGQVQAAFQPISVQAQAVNPDGSVVVALTGTLVMQAGGSPQTHQIVTDFLITKQEGNFRITGLYNRSYQMPH